MSEMASGQLQLYIRRDEVGEEAFEGFLTFVDLGDIIQASGTPFRTRTGEPSLRVTGYTDAGQSRSTPRRRSGTDCRTSNSATGNDMST